MFTAQTPAISFNLNMANFDRDQLPVQMTDTLKMAQFAIIECSQMDAKAYVHEKANPYLARMLSNGIKRELINLRPGQEGQADADAVTDTHFLVQYRKTFGFLVLVPDMIYQGFVHAQPVIRRFCSSKKTREGCQDRPS